MKPLYHITLGKAPLSRTESAAESILLSLKADAAAGKVNAAELKILAQPDIVPEMGETVEIELGEERVFTGIVREVVSRLDHLEVYCESELSRLADIRINKLYEEQTAGDIVRDMASRTELSTGIIEPGTTYPSYAVDAGRPLLGHLQQLAFRDGLDAYADHEGRLVFSRYTGGQVHSLSYGAQVISLKIEDQSPAVDGVEIYGESPASLGQGKDAFSWLTKKEIKGSAGSSNGLVVRLSDPSLRDISSAGLAARNIYGQMSQARSGQLKLLGQANIRLGDTVVISQLPQSGADGAYRVTGVQHRLSKRKGFITIVSWKNI